MRILVLSDKVLSQKTGDGLRVYGLLKPLLGRHTFDLICFARSGEQLSTDVRSLFDDVTLVPTPEPRAPPLLRRLVRSATVRDFKPTSGVMRGAIEVALRGHNYDLLLDVAANTVANLPDLPLDIPLVAGRVGPQQSPPRREFD